MKKLKTMQVKKKKNLFPRLWKELIVALATRQYLNITQCNSNDQLTTITVVWNTVVKGKPRWSPNLLFNIYLADITCCAAMLLIFSFDIEWVMNNTDSVVIALNCDDSLLLNLSKFMLLIATDTVLCAFSLFLPWRWPKEERNYWTTCSFWELRLLYQTHSLM